MEMIQATVPRRGDVLRYMHPKFFEDKKIQKLNAFYGHGADTHAGAAGGGGCAFSPFRAGPQEDGGGVVRPFTGLRQGLDISPPSSILSESVAPAQSVARTDRCNRSHASYPSTAATERPNEKQLTQTLEKTARHASIDSTIITEERIAMAKLQAENEQLRQMCGDLQSSLAQTVKQVRDVSEDAKHVARMAQRLANMQLANGRGDDLPAALLADEDFGESPEPDDEGKSPRIGVDAGVTDDNKNEAAPVVVSKPDVLRLDTTPYGLTRVDVSNAASTAKASVAAHTLGKSSTPRVDSVHSSRGKLVASAKQPKRDSSRPGTAVFTPRAAVPKITIHTSSRQQTPRDEKDSALPSSRGSVPLIASQSRPCTASAELGPPAGGSGSRPATTQSRPETTESTRIKRQRPLHSGRSYIALYRDSMLGQVESFSRLIFPTQHGQREEFLSSIQKKLAKKMQEHTKKKAPAVDVAASGDGGLTRFRPLSEMVEKKCWDGNGWKDPIDPTAPCDGFPGLRRQTHWEPPRGGGAGHSAPAEWNQLVKSKKG